MRQFIAESWDSVMNHDFNPLKHIPDLQVRHMVLQILAWMWCVVFSLYVGSWYLMGITCAVHFLLLPLKYQRMFINLKKVTIQ